MDSLSPDDTRLGSMQQVVEKWTGRLPHLQLEIETGDRGVKAVS
jgi:hypothetical protein